MHAFWTWFLNRELTIRKAYAASNWAWLRENLGVRVAALTLDPEAPKLGWEIGIGEKKPWRFAFSPLVQQNLELTRLIVRDAPCVELWEFHACKPPRRQNPFHLRYRFGEREFEVHTQDWSYELCQYPDGKFDIDLIPTTGLPMELDYAESRDLAYLVVEGIVGEEVMIQSFAATELRDSRDQKEEIRSRLKHLPAHLRHLGVAFRHAL